MQLDGIELDRIILAVIREAPGGGLSVKREDIAQAVLERITPHMVDYILPSLERLTERGVIGEEQDHGRSRSYVYYLKE